MANNGRRNALEVKHNAGDGEPSKILENLEKRENIVPVEIKAHTYEDAQLIAEAIRNKTTVVDLKKKKKYAFTSNSVIEITNRDIKAIEMTVNQEIEKFEETINRGFTAMDVSNILVKLESVHAAYLESEKIHNAINRLNQILAELIKNGTEDEKKKIRNGIVSFFSRSKRSISTDARKFRNETITLKNGEEKEYFRNAYISKMLQAGVVDYQLLVECGIITSLDFMTLDEVFRELGILTNEEFENACYLTGSFETREDILNYYSKKDKKFFTNFATIEEIIKFLNEEKIDVKIVVKRLKINEIKKLTPEVLEELLKYNNFPKGTEFVEYISKGVSTEKVLKSDFLKQLNREQLMKIVTSDKIKYKNLLVSDDYINLFGTLKIEDFELLLKQGFINEEDIIKLTKFKSLKIQDPEEYKKMIELQVKTYNFEELDKLLKEGKINKRFSELFNNFIEHELSEEQRNEFFEKIKNEIENGNKEEELVLLIQKGIDFGTLEYTITTSTIEDMYIDEKIAEQDILNLFKKEFISQKTLQEIFSQEELIENYRNGLIDYRVLNLVESRADVIRTELLDGKITIAQLMELYSSQDGIEIKEFLSIVENYEMKQELVDFLTDEITPEKVEDLFKNYYISQDELSVLVNRNIISKVQANEFAERIATKEEYEAIFNSDNATIILTEETPEGESKTKSLSGVGSKRTSRLKIDPELQELLLEQIRFDDNRATLRGTNNSLDGYKIYPSREFALMVFIKNDEPGNATYIMSLQQGMYFLKKMARNESIENRIIESNATKQGLRETEHVKVRNASAGWGKNVISEMKKLSPKFAEKIKENSEYTSAINVLIEDIREDYEERKNEMR